MKRLKNIEGKNKDQLDAIKDQGEKQLNEIEKQKKNKLKIIEKDVKIVYLRDGINKLFKIYPESFSRKNTNSLETFARNESIDYKNLSYKIIFYDETDVKSHEFSFLKRFGTLHDLLKNLLTSKTSTTNESIDQIAFITYLLMTYYDKIFLLKKQRYSKMIIISGKKRLLIWQK